MPKSHTVETRMRRLACLILGLVLIPYVACAQGLGEDDDGDGMKDFNEFVAGTDPNNAHDRLAIVSAAPHPPQNMVLQWPGVSGRFYGVQSRTDLWRGAWGAVTNDISATTPLNTVTVRSDEAGRTFYRLRVRKGE